MRLFFAVRVSEAIRRDIGQALKTFPLRNPPWRWISLENMHITLKFLGETDEGLLPDLREVAAGAARGAGPFRVAYGRFGGFPNLSRPRVLFFEGQEGTKELASIASALESGVEPLGIPRENRPFTAHLTVARIKVPLSRDVIAALGTVPPLPATSFQKVDRFSLMQSHLSREGATYEEVAGFPLAGS
jgi:2'-5' RNA ligase